MKDKHVAGKKMARYGLKMTIYQSRIRPIKHLKMTVRNLNLVKDKHTYGKKMARKGPTKVIYV